MVVPKLIFLAVALFASVASVSAQEIKFATSMAGSDLTPTQQQSLDQLQKLSSTKSIELYKLDVRALTENAIVNFPLPGDNAGAIFSVDKKSILSGFESFSVVGPTRTTDDDTPVENLKNVSTFVVDGDSVTGSIVTDNGVFRIRPIGGGAHAIIQVNSFPADEPPSNTEMNERDREMPFNDFAPLIGPTTEITVLVVYTSNVSREVTNIRSLVNLAVQETNNSYERSGVLIRLKLVSEDPLALNYEESNSFDVDLAALQQLGDGKMDEIHQVRDQLSADIVVLLVANSSYCGQAAQILAASETAFALVYYDCATTNLSFAHELGHLFGARHNVAADASINPFAYGHGYINGAEKRRTIMSYNCPENCVRYPEWSRPPQWGNELTEHDARVLNESRVYISGFR